MEQELHRLYFLLNFYFLSKPLISLWGTKIVKLGVRINIHYAIAKNILDSRNAEAYLYNPRQALQAYYKYTINEEVALQPLLLLITINGFCNMYFYLQTL